MYDYNYGYGYDYSTYEEVSGIASIIGGMFTIILIISLAIGIITLVSQWKIYKKAGKKGWECLIPIYNIIVLLQIVGLPVWYIALFFVPIANIYAMFKIYIELAHKFGKSTGFGVATVFFNIICLPILAFGKNSIYKGEGTNSSNNQTVENNSPPSFQNQFQTGNDNIMNNNSNVETPISFNQNINTNINPLTNNVNNIPIDTSIPEQQTFGNPTPQLNPVQNNNMGEQQLFQYNAPASETNSMPEPATQQSVGFNAIPSVPTEIPEPVANNTPQMFNPINNLPEQSPVQEQPNLFGNAQQAPMQNSNPIPNMNIPQQPVQNSNNSNM